MIWLERIVYILFAIIAFPFIIPLGFIFVFLVNWGIITL